jgi:hypothetical protein
MSKKKEYIVKEDGIPCAITPFPELFGVDMIPARGVIFKNSRRPTVFPGEKSAHAAIMRAHRLRRKLTDSMLSSWDKVQPYIQRGKFTVEPYTP